MIEPRRNKKKPKKTEETGKSEHKQRKRKDTTKIKIPEGIKKSPYSENRGMKPECPQK